MQVITFGGRKYKPMLTNDGKLDVRTAVAYGPAGRGQFMLTVYVRCHLQGAGTRGGEIQCTDINVMREMVPNTITEAAQLEKLTFMCNVMATKCNTDYRLRLPIETRRTPAYSRPKKEVTKPMGMFFDEYEAQLRKEMENGIQRP